MDRTRDGGTHGGRRPGTERAARAAPAGLTAALVAGVVLAALLLPGRLLARDPSGLAAIPGFTLPGSSRFPEATTIGPFPHAHHGGFPHHRHFFHEGWVFLPGHWACEWIWVGGRWNCRPLWVEGEWFWQGGW